MGAFIVSGVISFLLGICSSSHFSSCVSWIEKIVGVLDFGVGLLVKQLLHSISDRLGHKLQSMFSLYFVGIVEPCVFVEIPVNLLYLWHFPTVVLLRLGAIGLHPRLYLGLSAQSQLPGGTIDLLPQPLLSFCIVIRVFEAVELLPSLGLGSSQDHRSLGKNASLRIIIILDQIS